MLNNVRYNVISITRSGGVKFPEKSVMSHGDRQKNREEVVAHFSKEKEKCYKNYVSRDLRRVRR